MKRNISILLNILSLLLILEAVNFFNNLLLFLIAGAIPGTSVSFSPLFMFSLVVLAGYLLARRTPKIFDIHEEVTDRTMPRKRYARL